MRSIRNALFIALATLGMIGCGGKGGSIETQVADWAKKACECKDKKCAEDLAKKAEELEDKVEKDDKMAKDKKDALEAVYMKGVMCLASAVGE